MTKQMSAQALALLTAAFGKELPKPTVRIYLNAMEDLSPEVIVKACDEIIKTSKFFPTVAEIREVTMRLDENINLPLPWDAAWSEVMTKIQREGRNRETEWSSEAIPEALKALGGYQRVCEATAIGVVEARFKNAYERTAIGERRKALLGGSNEESDSNTYISDGSGSLRELGSG
jgi:hypothetical protein